ASGGFSAWAVIAIRSLRRRERQLFPAAPRCANLAPMKGAFIEQTGPPEVIQYGEIPTPEPRGRQIRVRVHAVAVNPIDTYVRSGMVPMDLPRPFIVGCDFAGTVDAVGEEATSFKVGDRVWGSNQGLMGRQGTFA